MNVDSGEHRKGVSKARWIAAGFMFAFAMSILTIIYTGLRVEGSPAEFKAGFRSVTMTVGEERGIELGFEAFSHEPEATLAIELPEMLDLVGRPGDPKPVLPVALEPGDNQFTVMVRAKAAGKGYLVARVAGEKPVGLDRVFVTVVDD